MNEVRSENSERFHQIQLYRLGFYFGHSIDASYQRFASAFRKCMAETRTKNRRLIAKWTVVIQALESAIDPNSMKAALYGLSMAETSLVVSSMTNRRGLKERLRSVLRKETNRKACLLRKTVIKSSGCILAVRCLASGG